MDYSCKVLTMVFLLGLILLPVQQCSARVRPYDTNMESLKKLARQEGEQEIHVDVHGPKQLQNLSNQKKNGGGGNVDMLFGGLSPSKAFGYVFSLLPKGSPIPPSGPSKGHNGIPNAHADPYSSNSDP